VLGTRDEADDVVQEAVCIALNKLHNFDPKTNFTAWMGQIVRNVARNTVRRKVRHRVNGSIHPGETAMPDESNNTAPLRAIDGHGTLLPDQTSFDDRVLSALNALDETPRACLLLRVVEDMPYAEIAQALDIPKGTAMSHVYRARETMRERIPRRLYSHVTDQDEHE